MTLHAVAMSPDIQAAFAACPSQVQTGMHRLRNLIFARAAELPAIGRVTEALRWGQPAYLTPDTGAACSLRIGPAAGGTFALFVHCKTGLIETFHAGPGAGLCIQGTRAVVFQTAADIPDVISLLIGRALTYHVRAHRVAQH